METGKKCANKQDLFCYVCGEYILAPNRTPITPFLRSVYRAYFGMKLSHQDKSWAPHMACKRCTEHLRQWSKGTRNSMKFGVPMIWKRPSNHTTDCYFCAVKIIGINQKNRRTMEYPNLPSATRPIPHNDEIPVPVFKNTEESSSEDDTQMIVTTDAFFPEDSDEQPERFSQNELNDLVCDLNLPKESAKLLASRLKDKNLLNDEIQIDLWDPPTS
ncbi:hypothetical protein Ahia01_000471600 [Argonauta hians]